jgi:hypothetical protein
MAERAKKGDAFRKIFNRGVVALLSQNQKKAKIRSTADLAISKHY